MSSDLHRMSVPDHAHLHHGGHRHGTPAPRTVLADAAALRLAAAAAASALLWLTIGWALA